MKMLRSVLLALLCSLLVGFLIGLALRSRLERRVEYIGSVAPARPLDVGDARAPVLDPRHHEEQIREPVEQPQRGAFQRLLVVERHRAALRAPAHRARHVEGAPPRAFRRAG